MMKLSEDIPESSDELSVSFGYQCSTTNHDTSVEQPSDFGLSTGIPIENNSKMRTRSSSFSCLSGAALSANATLANTNICNGLLGEEILPVLDSPKSFRRMSSSCSLSRLDSVSSPSQSSMSVSVGSLSTDNDLFESGRNSWKPMSAPTRVESCGFLNAVDVQMAGGAAGEDRVQAVCSEENGWLFCGVYDGFNGRDAADFLAGTLYDNIGSYLDLLEWRTGKLRDSSKSGLIEDDSIRSELSSTNEHDTLASGGEVTILPHSFDVEIQTESFCLGVMDCLSRALAQAESDFMYMVEQEMDERPDLVSVGSCVLVVLLHVKNLYILNLGDSRAVLAAGDNSESNLVKAIQLTETHTVDNEEECRKVVADHPDDPSPIVWGRVKGKLKLTRAFGVGYLKKSNMNDALMGILRVRNLCSPPYVYTHPYTRSHRLSDNDRFVVLGSDGLFDFFSNDEVVQHSNAFILDNPSGDPAKYLVEQLVLRAAESAGFSTEELMRIPAGRRRKYHDDVTVMVIILGNKQRMSTASTSL